MSESLCDFCHGATGKHDFIFRSAFGLLSICSNCVEAMNAKLSDARENGCVVVVEAKDWAKGRKGKGKKYEQTES